IWLHLLAIKDAQCLARKVHHDGLVQDGRHSAKHFLSEIKRRSFWPRSWLTLVRLGSRSCGVRSFLLLLPTPLALLLSLRICVSVSLVRRRLGRLTLSLFIRRCFARIIGHLRGARVFGGKFAWCRRSGVGCRACRRSRRIGRWRSLCCGCF